MNTEIEFRSDFLASVKRRVDRFAGKVENPHTRSINIRENIEAYTALLTEMGIMPKVTIESASGTEQIRGTIIKFDPEKRAGLLLNADGKILRYRVRKKPISDDLSYPQKESFTEINSSRYKQPGILALRSISRLISSQLN